MEYDDILQSDIDDIIKSVYNSHTLNDNYKRALIQWIKSNVNPKHKIISIEKHFFYSINAIGGMKSRYTTKEKEGSLK